MVAGLSVVETIFSLVDTETIFEPAKSDGQSVDEGDLIAQVRGSGPGFMGLIVWPARRC